MKAFGNIFLAGCVAVIITGPAVAQDNPMIGGAAIDHTARVTAVQVAELIKILQGERSFTVFTPTKAAFDALAAGTVENLLKPENKDAPIQVLTCHAIDKALLPQG